MRTFVFEILDVVDEIIGRGKIEIDESVIECAKTKEFTDNFYTFPNDESIAAHIAWRMVIWNEKLSEIEGFMMPDALCKIIDRPYGYDNFSVEAHEA